MRLAKFIKKLDNGEITDLKPYIEKEKLDILLEIADRGLEVDYLLRRGETEVIRTLIQNGHASEYYDFWKHHSDKTIREEMAKKGLFRNEFIKDVNYEVRLAAAGNEPEYLMKLANCTDSEKREIARRFSLMPDLTVKELDFILQFEYGRYNKQAFRLKREGLLKEPTALEKTLTVTQLFTLDNALWTLGISADNIHHILDYHKHAKQNGWAEQFSGLLDLIVANNYEYSYGIYSNYLKKLGIKEY